MQDRVIITGPSFVDVFSIEIVKGDARKSLSTPMTAVLTKSTAHMLFGTEDVVGRTFKFRTKFLITVGAVIEDLRGNTHLPATMLISHFDNPDFLASSNENYFGPGQWGTMLGTETFITLNSGQDINGIVAQLETIVNKYINNDVQLGESKCEFVLQPLEDLHFDQKYGGGPWVNSMNKNWLVFFGIIAALVLIMACINFINLTTASSLARAREVGIRKTAGASRMQLLAQFLTEALVIVAISMGLSVAIISFTLPYINSLIETDLQVQILSFDFLIVTSTGVLMVVLIAGLYPSLVISRFRSITALTSNTYTSSFSLSLRRIVGRSPGVGVFMYDCISFTCHDASSVC